MVNDKPIKTYNHNDNKYIEAFKNSKFSIKITNNSYFGRVLAVVTVDGLSVVDGEIASENSPGYIIGARDSMTVDGWQKDLENVAEFVFDVKKNGYAAKTEQGGHEGSIGVMIFGEYIKPTIPFWSQVNTRDASKAPRPMYTMSDNTNTSCSTQNYSSTTETLSPCEPLAVSHGDNLSRQFSHGRFDKSPARPDLFVFYYDNRKGLEKRGIKFNEDVIEPSPFPASSHFCKRPRNGW